MHLYLLELNIIRYNRYYMLSVILFSRYNRYYILFCYYIAIIYSSLLYVISSWFNELFLPWYGIRSDFSAFIPIIFLVFSHGYHEWNCNVSRLTVPSGMIMSTLDGNHFFNGLVFSTISINHLFKGRWTIDSSVRNHVVHSLSCFQSSRYVTDKTFVLPNSSVIPVV